MDPVSRWVRDLRPPREEAPDPWQAAGWTVEEEREADGTVRPAVTVFLTGAECPFTCVFCDLWRFTLPGPTPPGALPTQLRAVLEMLAAGELPRKRWPAASLKLYNASNFFDARAVPPQDDEALARLAAPFRRVVVECHPRLVLSKGAPGRRWRAFADRLRRDQDGRLEVALGLETVHPTAAAQLNKQSDPELFRRAAEALRAEGVGVRAFVLLGTPYLPGRPSDPPSTAAAESVRWTVRSVEEALAAGARQVAIIPVRGGNGALEALARQGQFRPPTLADLEAALFECLRRGTSDVERRGAVAADLWDLAELDACPICFPARRERLRRMNLSGTVEEPIPCEVCGSSPDGGGMHLHPPGGLP